MTLEGIDAAGRVIYERMTAGEADAWHTLNGRERDGWRWIGRRVLEAAERAEADASFAPRHRPQPVTPNPGKTSW